MYKEVFDQQLSHKSKELNGLCSYICKARKSRNEKDKLYQQEGKIGAYPHTLDYKKCLLLLPEITDFSNEDLNIPFSQEAAK